jgi:hypothetical protein
MLHVATLLEERLKFPMWLGAMLLATLALPPATAGAQPFLDEGKLDPAWFGGPLEFREADEIDYLWVKPGFVLDGAKVRFAPWEANVFLGEKAAERDAKDKRLAADLTEDLPDDFAEAFRNALGGKVQVVDSGETVRVVGQVVDCTTGSAAAKFWVGMGAGSGATTFNLKFVDAKSGELVAAIHHRVVSGSNLSTTDSKLVDWIDEFAESIAKSGLPKLYEKGKKRKS